jgi:hypothetical protein
VVLRRTNFRAQKSVRALCFSAYDTSKWPPISWKLFASTRCLMRMAHLPPLAVGASNTKRHCRHDGVSGLSHLIPQHYSSVKTFNKLPQNIFKYCNDIHNFKTLLRDYLVKNAFYSIEEFLSAGHNNVAT